MLSVLWTENFFIEILIFLVNVAVHKLFANVLFTKTHVLLRKKLKFSMKWEVWWVLFCLFLKFWHFTVFHLLYEPRYNNGSLTFMLLDICSRFPNQDSSSPSMVLRIPWVPEALSENPPGQRCFRSTVKWCLSFSSCWHFHWHYKQRWADTLAEIKAVGTQGCW